VGTKRVPTLLDLTGSLYNEVPESVHAGIREGLNKLKEGQ